MTETKIYKKNYSENQIEMNPNTIDIKMRTLRTSSEKLNNKATETIIKINGEDIIVKSSE